jgi:hypothetical protein
MPNEIWKTVYFKKTGSENTDKTLELAKKRGQSSSELGILLCLHEQVQLE